MTQHNHQTAPTQFFEANGIRFAYRRFGKAGGVPLVFNQHFRGTMDYWDPAVTDGLAKNREVIQQAAAQREAIGKYTAPGGSILAYLKEICQPTLIVQGSNDAIVPTVNSYILQQNLPNAQLILYPDANGPGAMSLQGAKGAVSADGPQTPGRVQINKGMVGFLTHTGYSHGGNGFEGMAFLLERFQGIELKEPTDPNHGIDLAGMAKSFAEAYREEKANARELGAAELRALPGVHHPVFKGKPVNYDPRERFIAKFMEEHDDYNIFHAYYRELAQALYDAGATPYVFCVNVDAIIAALLLAVLWQDYRSGTLTVKDLETAAFNVFLYGRMIGAAAEIDDHLNRGRNMDMRTPQDNCRFIV